MVILVPGFKAGQPQRAGPWRALRRERCLDAVADGKGHHEHAKHVQKSTEQGVTSRNASSACSAGALLISPQAGVESQT